jgi:hypothetical protein
LGPKRGGIGKADVGDQQRFPARPVRAGGRVSPLPVARERDLSVAAGGDGARASLGDALRGTHTRPPPP